LIALILECGPDWPMRRFVKGKRRRSTTVEEETGTVFVEVWDIESGWTTNSSAFYSAREARRYMKEHGIEEGMHARVMDHGSLKKNIDAEKEFRRKKRKMAKEELHK